MEHEAMIVPTLLALTIACILLALCRDPGDCRMRRRSPWSSVSFVVCTTKDAHAGKTLDKHEEDMQALREWQRKHPHGPVTPQESKEFDNLVMYAIGSRMLMKSARNESFLKDVTYHRLHEKIADWRV